MTEPSPPLGVPEDAIDIGRVDDFQALLGAIAADMPTGAVLYLEEVVAAADVVAFLDARRVSDPCPVQANTIVPAPTTHHMLITPENMAGLIAVAAGRAGHEVADHLVVYQAGHVLLWAHDAGYGDVLLSPRLGEERIGRLSSALAPAQENS